MKADRSKLRQALSVVKPALASKEVLEQTTSFAFRKGRVIAYNDEISISHPVEGLEFEGAVKAEELYGLLERAPKDEIELEVKEDELRFACGKVKAGLKMESKIHLPIKSPPEEWEELKSPEQFCEFLGLASHTCSTDMAQPKLTCIFVSKKGVVLGADGFRIIRCVGKKMPVEDFLIPATSVSELIKINPTQLQLDEGWIHFKNEVDTIFSCRRLDEDYIPNEQIETAFEMDKKEDIVFPDKIETMLDRVKQFAKRGFSLDEIINVWMEDGKLKLRAEAEETKSWIEEKSSIDSKATISFALTPVLFENILRMTHSCELDKKVSKVKFVAKDWEYIVMLRDTKK